MAVGYRWTVPAAPGAPDGTEGDDVEAVVVTGGELEVQTRPDPVPGDTELLVAVRAAGLNGADLAQRRGLYAAPPGSPPDIPGLELAGEVVAVGRQVTRFAEGDPVMAVVGGGGQASLCTVDETHAPGVPAGLGWAEAGGFPEVFTTAFDALWRQGELVMGDRVLVSGAGGGVGTAGVQLAAAAGAQVVASVRHQEHERPLAELGATTVIRAGTEGDHGPYDVVLELVGGPGFVAALGALATGGRAVVIGVGGGATVELNLFTLMGKRARVSGSTLRTRSREEKAAVAAGVTAHVLPLLAAGRLTVPVWGTFPLAQATQAYDRFAVGGKLGKLVLEP